MAATIKALIFRYQMETVVLVLPVATMIAFARLRVSMPNVPAGFGLFSFLSFLTILMRACLV
jgi:hypothetical protein